MASFDLYESEEAEDLYENGEAEAARMEGGSNRAFIIVAGALGGILVLALIVFVIYAAVLAPRMKRDLLAQSQAVIATNEAIQTAAASGGITAEMLTQEAAILTPASPTPAPTDTPRPTNTPLPSPTPTAIGEEPSGAVAEGTPGGETPADATATPATVARAGTATPRPGSRTPTPASGAASKAKTPETGIGVLGGGALAVGLLALLMMVRRLRRAS